MKNILSLILTIILLAGCYNHKDEDINPAKYTPQDTISVTYTRDIQPLIAGKCAIPGCHVTGAQSPDLSAYSGVYSNRSRVMERAVIQKNMPPTGPLANDEINKLKKWLEAGATNN